MSQTISFSVLFSAISYDGPVLCEATGLYNLEAVRAIEQAAARLGWRVLPKGLLESYRRWLPRGRRQARSLRGLCKAFCACAEQVAPSEPWIYSL